MKIELVHHWASPVNPTSMINIYLVETDDGRRFNIDWAREDDGSESAFVNPAWDSPEIPMLVTELIMEFQKSGVRRLHTDDVSISSEVKL